MKILYSCLSKSWGGMEMYTLTSVKQLLVRNVQVEILCLRDSTLFNKAKREGIVAHTIKNDNYLNLQGILKIISLLQNGKFDLIHTQASRDLWQLVPALKIINTKIPLVFTKQVGSFIIKKDFLHKIIYNRINIAFAISEAIKQNMIDTTPLTPEKVLLIHNCIDVNKFDPEKSHRAEVRNEFKVGESEILIGMMARFSPGKGHEEFLAAAKSLNDKYDNLKFMIVGKASYREENYEKEIKSLASSSIKQNILFPGFREDTADILSAMDIFVFPSHAEAFGIALIEAMAMELPTVSANAEGVLDITVDKETGFLFENKNAGDLSEKVTKLIDSKEKRIAFGKKGRQRVRDKFNLDIQTKKVLEIYSSLISGIE
jgi:glycosyltransferase involved in cell wall biosynthesis